MTDDRMNELFEALKHEQPFVQSNDVLEWLDHDCHVQIAPESKSDLKLKLLLGIVSAIAVLSVWLWIEGNHEKPKNTKKQPFQTKDHVENLQDSSGPLTVHSTLKTNEMQVNTIAVNDSLDLPSVEVVSVLQSDDESLTQQKIGFMPEEEDESVFPLVLTVQPEKRDFFFMLDSLKSYGLPGRFRMDEPDCYVQIYRDYAVISYRLRGRTYFSAGTIHREETQVIDGKTYTVMAFQADNNRVSSNFGSRVFFGFRILENRANDIEVVFFSQPWAPTAILVGHTATPEERRKLIERSKSQQHK